MSSKSNLHETAYLKLVYQNIAIPNIGNAGGLPKSSTDGSLFIALFTASPTESDSGTEATYTGYIRKSVARGIGNWTVDQDGSTDARCRNASVITWETSTGVSNDITHFGVYTNLTGGDLIHYGATGSTVTIATGDTPKMEINQLVIIEK